MLSVTQIIHRRMTGLYWNERNLKRSSRALIKVSSRHSPIRKYKTCGNPLDNKCSGRDTNRTRLQHETAELPAETTCPVQSTITEWMEKLNKKQVLKLSEMEHSRDTRLRWGLQFIWDVTPCPWAFPDFSKGPWILDYKGVNFLRKAGDKLNVTRRMAWILEMHRALYLLRWRIFMINK
jgi:hypothetical protein